MKQPEKSLVVVYRQLSMDTVTVPQCRKLVYCLVVSDLELFEYTLWKYNIKIIIMIILLSHVLNIK